ncbi:hypothetical protein PPAR_b0159 [Pseudoalteromonas paragorgicola KMM 3548]|nr:hypothetical protein [Pseudoalteromonas distincta KMM 3548]
MLTALKLSDATYKLLGRVELWWVNLQQYVWFLGKAEPM